MGVLYDATVDRLDKIRALGYEIEIIWERDWDTLKKTL